jgi:hypothetical protein
VTNKDIWQLGISIVAVLLACASLIWQTVKYFQEKHARRLAVKERLAREELARITPTHDQFREMILRHGPPQKWYDENFEGLY